MPRLRDRREDIPLLVRAWQRRRGEIERGLAAALTVALLLHPWPLNVRGLFNVLSVAALACPAGSPLNLVPEVARALDAARAIGEASFAPEPRDDTAKGAPKEVPTAAELEQALSDAVGSISATARALGCSRQQLYRWIEARGVNLASHRLKG